MAQRILCRNLCRICSDACFITSLAPRALSSLQVPILEYFAYPRQTFQVQGIRQKYSDKSSKRSKEYDTDSDDEEEFTSDRDSKIVKTKLNSLRADLILKTGLNIARNKIETHFYDSKIRVNGQKLLKKSSQLKVGDEIDIVKGPSPHNSDHLIISRVEILSASPKDENLSVVLRRYKTMTIENYKDEWCSPAE